MSALGDACGRLRALERVPTVGAFVRERKVATRPRAMHSQDVCTSFVLANDIVIVYHIVKYVCVLACIVCYCCCGGCLVALCLRLCL